MVVPGVGSFNDIDPKDAFSWGLRLGFLVTPNVEVGGLFNLQSTSLEVSGTTAATIGDQKIDNYHGYLAYNFGDDGSKVRPYFLGGLGATQYRQRQRSAREPTDGTIGGNTQFSTTWALGVKMYPGKNVGIGSKGAGLPPTSSRTRPAGGATRTGAATSPATRSTRTSSSSPGGITLRF